MTRSATFAKRARAERVHRIEIPPLDTATAFHNVVYPFLRSRISFPRMKFFAFASRKDRKRGAETPSLRERGLFFVTACRSPRALLKLEPPSHTEIPQIGPVRNLSRALHPRFRNCEEFGFFLRKYFVVKRGRSTAVFPYTKKYFIFLYFLHLIFRSQFTDFPASYIPLAIYGQMSFANYISFFLFFLYVSQECGC